MKNNRLQFTYVEIQEHPVILDTSHGISTGIFLNAREPFLQLSWDAENKIIVDIDAYEMTRQRRRRGRELWLSRCQGLQKLSTK